MTHKRLWISATIIASVLIVGFVLSVPHTSDVDLKSTERFEEPVIPSIELKDTFKKGVHTITGSIEAANACVSVNAEASLVGSASSTQNILVAISVVDDKGICLQIPTKIPFSASITAPAGLPVMATINGAEVTTVVL